MTLEAPTGNKNYDSVLKYIDKAYKNSNEQGNKPGMTASLRNMADLHSSKAETGYIFEALQEDFLQRAVGYGKESFGIAQKVGSLTGVRDAYKVLYKAPTRNWGIPAKHLRMLKRPTK